MEYVTKVKEWIIARWSERTTWDGTLLIVGGVSYLVLSPLADYVAYASIGYGAWTLWKKESN